MATPSLTVTDLLHLYKPGQLSDMVSMLRKSLMLVTSATFSTAAQGDIRGLGTDITAVVTKASVAGVINTSGPNAAQINTILTTYKTIPITLSGYIQPPPITEEQELAKDNALFSPIITHLNAALDDLCTKLIFFIIKDNEGTTDATKIDNIKNMILSFLTYTNDVPTRIKIPGTLLGPNFGEISIRLSDILSTKLGVFVPQPGGMSIQDLAILCSNMPASVASGDPAVRKTPTPPIMEVSITIRYPLNNIINTKTFDKYNAPNTISLIKSIPNLIVKLFNILKDPMMLKYYGDNVSMYVYPIPEPTNSLFTNLNKSNFSASLSQPTTGILSYFVSSTFGQVPTLINQLVQREGMLARSTLPTIMAEINTKTVGLLKAYINIVNAAINTFKIKMKDDGASLRVVEFFNSYISKSGFKINIVPTASGGKRSKRSRKLRQKRRRTVKNLTPK